MAREDSAAPLIALDAVALDTETTGLDARKAWIVEVAAVRFASGRIDPSGAFRRLVRPGESIPAAATRIHGIDDNAVAGATPFAEVWPPLKTYISDAIVVGHAIGFDLAVLDRECRRAGLAFAAPRTLDTRLLAELVAPQLVDYSLESLGSWLDVKVVDRHSALGDALLTARLFLALVPKLRERGIRTLAEAERACRVLSGTLDAQHRAGWFDTLGSGKQAAGLTGRIDSYPFRHRIGDVMSAPAKFIGPNIPLRAAIERMVAERVSSLFVHPGAGERPPLAAETGIVTERDVQRILALAGTDGFAKSIHEIASRPLITVPADAFAFLAMARMNRFQIRHLGVTDGSGQVIGAVSARDLLRLRAEESIALGDEIDHATDVIDLGRAWANLPRVVAALRADELSGRQIAELVSHQLCAVTQRAAVLGEQRMQDSGHGAAPCDYAFAVLGSGGRGESLMALDQDNAVIFAEGASSGAEDRWFEAHATHVADILHEVGIPYCKGGVMAKNPPWRGSLSTWHERIGGWLRRSNPTDVLSVDIFFDMRPVYGDAILCTNLWRDAFDAARDEIGFAKLLAEAAGSVESGLGFFGHFRTRQGRIDLKKAGLFGIVTTARVLAIRHHVVERSTLARLAGIKALGIGAESDLDALVEAQGVFLDLLVAQQIEDIERGIPPSNAAEVRRLSRRDRERLHSALEAVHHLEDLTHDLLFKD